MNKLKSKHIKQPLEQQIAQNIRSYISLHPEMATLPGAQGWASKFNCSHVTALKALRHLRDDGLLEFRRGQPIHLKGSDFQEKEAPDIPQHDTDAKGHAPGAAMEKYLIHNIETGVYRIGQPLPKQQFFINEFHISPNSAVGVLKALETEHLIHKSGKNWIVGIKPHKAHKLPMDPPVIFVLLRNDRTWYDYLIETWLGGFCWVVNQEADRLGIKLEPIYTESLGNYKLFTCGKDEIRYKALGLGERYLGTIVFNCRFSENTFEWFHFLCGLGKPVFRFTGDIQYHKQWYEELPNLYLCNFGDWGSLEKKGAVATALDTLIQNGHRNIALVYVKSKQEPEYEGWARIRCEWFIKYAFAYGKMDNTAPPKIRFYCPDESFWKNNDKENQIIVETLYKKGTNMVKRLLKFKDKPGARSFEDLDRIERNLIEDTALLAPILKDSSNTAIVALQDSTAIRCFYWFMEMGMNLPADISMVSFDNSQIIKPYNISSVDLGVHSMGYKVLHFLAKDIIVKPENKNQFWGDRFLNHTGTIGPPGNGIARSKLRGDCKACS